jgi:hypothetical protein
MLRVILKSPILDSRCFFVTCLILPSVFHHCFSRDSFLTLLYTNVDDDTNQKTALACRTAEKEVGLGPLVLFFFKVLDGDDLLREWITSIDGFVARLVSAVCSA